MRGVIPMKSDLTHATFIIPIRIESDDRLRNVITTLCYLITKFDTNIIIHEHSETSVFEEVALPQIAEYCSTIPHSDDLSCIKHTFIKTSDPTFHRQKVLNDMLMESTTSVVINYDCDILLPYESYKEAYNLIMNCDADVVYPYQEGNTQLQVHADDSIVSEFLNDYCNFKILAKSSTLYDAKYGFCQFFNRDAYIEGGMENENFKAYAPEDVERYYRFTNLGYNVKRCGNVVYHLEHARTPNSWFSNPHMEENNKEWQKVQAMSKDELYTYITSQPYYIERTNGQK